MLIDIEYMRLPLGARPEGQQKNTRSTSLRASGKVKRQKGERYKKNKKKKLGGDCQQLSLCSTAAASHTYII